LITSVFVLPKTWLTIFAPSLGLDE